MAKQLGDQRRPIYLTGEQAAWIVHLIKALGDDEHNLIPMLEQIYAELRDAVVRLREVEAREKANAFWMEPQEKLKARINQLEKKKQHHRKADEGQACLTPKQLKKMLKEKKRREQREKIERLRQEAYQSRIHVVGDTHADLVEQVEQPTVSHTEEHGGLGATVAGDEAKHLEVVERNGEVRLHGDAEAPLA